MRQSKWQPMVDLGIGVYLTTNSIRTFTLLNFFTYSLTPTATPALCPLGLNFPSQQGYHCPARKAIPWHSPTRSPLVSRIFPHFQDLSSIQDLHLPFSRPPPFYWEHFLSGILHFITRSSFQNSRTPFFPVWTASVQKHNAHDQPCNWWFCLISSLTAGFGMCHFCLVQVLPKFTTSLYQLQLVSSRLLLDSSEVQLQTFTPAHIHPTICALLAFTI